MRKIVTGFVLACVLFGMNHAVTAKTPDPPEKKWGIILAPEDETKTCGMAEKAARDAMQSKTDPEEKKKIFVSTYQKEIAAITDVGTKIKGGCVQLSDLPILIIHLIDLCTKLAGTIAVIFLLYAGFQMILSGVTDDREKAKNTIKYALTGLIVSFLAWVIVNLIQVQLTS
jgi:hypothetical protein